jgi:DNA-binding CsgD family transcriptional regulator/tetratricopeptide (TPR) repeat protein
VEPAAAIESLLERDAELTRIDAAVAEARTGRGRFLVIEGPAGIGKTALLAAGRTAMADGGMRVLRSRGTQLEREFAFGVVRQLFEPPLVEAFEPERADLLQGAAGVAAGLLSFPGAPPAGAAPESGVDPSFAILHGLYWLCANLAAAGPLCLVVDDAHWADTPSVRFLAFLLTRLEELSTALVVATRTCETGSDADLLATLTADPAAEVIHLRPLSREAVGRLVETRLGGAPDPAVVDTCLRVTGGTPFLVRELVDALSREGIVGGIQAVGRSVLTRLGRLPEHAARLARAVAVLEQSHLLPAARLAGLAELEAAEAADLLANAGILAPGRPLMFVHPLVRSGIYSELSSTERARGHRRAAELLAEHPGASAQVAQHLLVSEPAADGWVVERLVEAASAAGKQGAPESEAVFLRRALVEPPPLAEQSRLLLDLGMAEASTGHADWANHLASAADAAPSPAAAAEAAMVLAHALSRAQRFAEAVEVLDRASARLDRRDSELELRLVAAAVVPGINDPATAPIAGRRAAALRAHAAADSAAPSEVLAVAAFTSVLTNEPADAGANLATRALDAGGGMAAGSDGRPWLSFAAWFSPTTLALLWAERYAQVRPLLDESITRAQATGDSSRLAMALANRAWLALRRGDLCAAETDASTALGAIELPAPPAYRVLNRALFVESLVEQGRLDDAEEALAPFQPDAEGTSLVAAALRFARGRLRLAQGRVAEGLEDALAVGALLTRALVTCPSYLPWRSEAALAHLALGQHEAAGRLAAEELDLACAFGAPRTLGVAKRGSGLVVGGDRGASLLREAIDDFEQADAMLERARALADLGAMLRRRNQRTEARKFLREALDAAHHASANRLVAYAETELRATGARPRRVVLRGLDSLTASERRIAEFASQGRTNREIAQTLFVTSRTVEGHLTSVFRKLQIDSRDELPAVLASGTAVRA